MNYQYLDICESGELQMQAAKILHKTFFEKGNQAWPDIKSAIKEIKECIKEPNICIGICQGDILLGWVGLRPMYEKTWELHPMVIRKESQNKGIGKLLIGEIEKRAKAKGIIGIVLGTDDENGSTSLSNNEINESNIFMEIENIVNLQKHPFEFYKKCGYFIVGIIPNANGHKKPDIWMWKNIK